MVLRAMALVVVLSSCAASKDDASSSGTTSPRLSGNDGGESDASASSCAVALDAPCPAGCVEQVGYIPNGERTCATKTRLLCGKQAVSGSAGVTCWVRALDGAKVVVPELRVEVDGRVTSCSQEDSDRLATLPPSVLYAACR